MTLKRYLLVMAVLTVIGWGIFLFVAGMVDPTATNFIGFFLFYLALFVALVGTIALIGFLIRSVIHSQAPIFALVKTAFRQSFLLALFIVALLILKSLSLFNLLNLTLLIIIFAILEIFWLSRQNYRHK